MAGFLLYLSAQFLRELEYVEFPYLLAKGLVYRPPVVVAQRHRAREQYLGLQEEELLGDRLNLRFDALSQAHLEAL